MCILRVVLRGTCAKIVLFRRDNISLIFAYSLAIHSGIAIFLIFNLEMAFDNFWTIIVWAVHWLVNAFFFDQRFGFKREVPGSGPQIFYATPVFGFLVTIIELLSERKLAKRIFYPGEISNENPWGAVGYSFVILLAIIIISIFYEMIS
jgi:hypothetical protein